MGQWWSLSHRRIAVSHVVTSKLNSQLRIDLPVSSSIVHHHQRLAPSQGRVLFRLTSLCFRPGQHRLLFRGNAITSEPRTCSPNSGSAAPERRIPLLDLPSRSTRFPPDCAPKDPLLRTRAVVKDFGKSSSQFQEEIHHERRATSQPHLL